MKAMIILLVLVSSQAWAITLDEEKALMMREVSEDEAKGFVTKAFHDPDSAKFRNMWRKNQWAWCGEVNAKNLYGAYVGYRKFHVNWFVGDPVVHMENRQERSEIVDIYCANKP